MATDSSDNTAAPAAPDHLKPKARKRLETLMEHGLQQTKQGNHDYAHDMYASCVNKDPGNLTYVEALLSNLEQKYKNNKKGGRGKGSRADFKQSVTDEDWAGVIEHGLELLKFNPWDSSTLRPMADACAALTHNEVELRYLKSALNGKPKDIEINRHCATSLARMGQFDQAIACWHRIEELSKSHKPEALKMISQLTMEKTKVATGMTEEEITGIESPSSGDSSKPAKAKANPTPASPTPAKTKATADNAAAGVTSSSKPTTTEQTSDPKAESPASGSTDVASIEAAIVEDPAEVSNYLNLAKLHQSNGDLESAIDVLTRAQAASGNAMEVQEKLETVQLLVSQKELKNAERAAKQKPRDAKLKEAVAAQKETLNRAELSYYSRRTQRYPDNLTLKYELAIRLKRAGNYAEAAKYFEEAAANEKLLPLAKLNQGECLQQTRQYLDALAAYELAAVKGLESDQIQAHKLSLYRAGMLATGLKDADQSVRFFEQLAGLDPDFRDVQLRLDKARKMRQTE